MFKDVALAVVIGLALAALAVRYFTT